MRQKMPNVHYCGYDKIDFLMEYSTGGQPRHQAMSLSFVYFLASMPDNFILASISFSQAAASHCRIPEASIQINSFHPDQIIFACTWGKYGGTVIVGGPPFH